MNPYVSKISQLLVSALKILIILMVLVADLVQSGHKYQRSCGDGQPVKPGAFYNECSMKFLRIRGGREVVADQPQRTYTLLSVTIESHGFLLFDSEANMFICWKKFKKNRNYRLVPRRNPKDLNACIFEELAADKAHTKYVSQKYNYTMSFSKTGTQKLIKQSKSKSKKQCPSESFMRMRQYGENCSSSYNEFCDKLKRIKLHKVATELRLLCNLEGSHPDGSSLKL